MVAPLGNKERCRRLEKLGLMTENGRKACPDLDCKLHVFIKILWIDLNFLQPNYTVSRHLFFLYHIM